MAALNINVNAMSVSAAASVSKGNVNASNGVNKAPRGAERAHEVSDRKRQREKSGELSGKATAKNEKVDLSREASEVASVSVSEDGDVVAVSENGARALNGENGGRGAAGEDGSVTRRGGEKDIALEERRALSEERSELAKEAVEAAEEDGAVEEEGYEPEINSLVGYTDSQVEQLYRDGKISYNDMRETEEQREAVREAEKEEIEEMDAFNAKANDALRRQSLEDIAINNIEDEEDGEVFDAMERINNGGQAPAGEPERNAAEIPGTVVTDREAENREKEDRSMQNERRAEEAGRLWDYQLRA